MSVARKSKMDEKALDRLAKTPDRATCFKCGSKRTYTNPMARCFECKNKFCFDDLNSGQINSEMSKNDPIRDICDACRIKFKYQTL